MTRHRLPPATPAATMHPCLQIDEIVRNIAFCVDRDEQRSARLLSMALTCRAFYEPAMDALWETMGSYLGPILLLRSSPRTRRRCLGCVPLPRFFKTPTASEWDRVLHHTRRVRYWTYCHIFVNDVLVRGVPPGYTGTFLFPNLRRIDIQNIEGPMDPTFIMPPSLQTIHLRSGTLSTLERIMRHLPSCRSVQTLKLMSGANTSYLDLEDVLVNSLLRHSKLQVLHVEWLGIPSNTFMQLASLEHLEDLSFWVSDQELVYVAPPRGNIFRALRKLSLSVTSRDPDSLLALLRGFPEIRLQHLAVALSGRCRDTSRTPDWPPNESTTHGAQSARYMDRLSAAIAAARFPALSVLAISVSHDIRHEEVELIITPTSLAHLLPLRGLTELDIAQCAVYKFSRAFRGIANAWPHLQTLRVGRPREGTAPYEVTDLLPLIHCRELHTLCVHLSGPVSSAALALRPPLGASRSPLKVVDLAMSTVINEAHLAVFLYCAFPLADVLNLDYWGSNEAIRLNRLLSRLRRAGKVGEDVDGPEEDFEYTNCPRSEYTIKTAALRLTE